MALPMPANFIKVCGTVRESTACPRVCWILAKCRVGQCLMVNSETICFTEQEAIAFPTVVSTKVSGTCVECMVRAGWYGLMGVLTKASIWMTKNPEVASSHGQMVAATRVNGPKEN